jgi:hypothetical protein
MKSQSTVPLRPEGCGYEGNDPMFASLLVIHVELLESVFRFMTKAGLSKQMIEEVAAYSMRGSQRKRTQARNPEIGNMGRLSGYSAWVVMADAVRAWHRSAEFLDTNASPRALRAGRGARGLHALIESVDAEADAPVIVKLMKKLGVIHKAKSGGFLPQVGHVTVNRLHPVVVEYAAKSFIRMIDTVCRNTDPKGRAFPLIERSAYVSDLSRSEARRFAAFTHARGKLFLDSVDDWLAQRRVRRRPKGRVGPRAGGIGAGVHLVAHLDDSVPAVQSGSAARGRR